MTTILLSTTDADTLLSPEKVREAAALYGLGVDEFGPAEKGYRNQSYAFRSGRRWYNLVLHKHGSYTNATAQRINSLGSELAATGLPVRATADSRMLLLRVGDWTRLASLYYYLPGKTIPWEAYTMKHIKLLGWALADLHQAAASLSPANLPAVESISLQQLQKMKQYFSAKTMAAVEKKLDVVLDVSRFVQYSDFFEQIRLLPHRQVLHMDFVRGNVLFDEAEAADRWQIHGLALTGILDLEKAAVGRPVMDIARTLTFLLTDCSQKTEAQVRKYFLQSGYSKRGHAQLSLKPYAENGAKSLSVKLANGEKYDFLELAVDFFLLYDFYKFLRSNPYESLKQNYHYCRTRDIMLKRNLLHYI